MAVAPSIAARRRGLLALALIVGALPFLGCQSVPESRGLTRTAYAKATLSQIQIRLLLNDFTVRFALRVEEAADRILAASPSREVSRHALLWKINGISACFQASARQDPVGAFGDVTILALQMRQFFEEGAGVHLFGAGQAIAVSVSRELEQEVLELRALLSGDKSGLEQGTRNMREIVARAPLTDLTFVRASIIREYLSTFQTQERGVFEVVGSIDETVAGLKEMMALQLLHLPKRMRWEAELVLLDLDREPSLAAPLESIASLKAALDRLVSVTETIPGMLTEEGKAILNAVTSERSEAMKDVLKIRDETMTQVDRLRSTTVDEIRQERRVVLAEVDGQFQKFTAALDGLTHRRVEEALAGADGLFGRALQAAFLGGTALAAAILGAAFVLRRRA